MPCLRQSTRRRTASCCVASSNGATSALRVCSFSAQRYVRAHALSSMTTLLQRCRSRVCREHFSPATLCATCKRAAQVRDFLEQPFRDAALEATFFEAALDEDTARLASGFDAACLFVNDTASAAVMERLAAGGVRFLVQPWLPLVKLCSIALACSFCLAGNRC